MSLRRHESEGQTVYGVYCDSHELGCIVVDSTICGRARGGLRMVADVSEGELRAAARAMTLKYGFLGLPQGGAKAGIRSDAEASAGDRRQALSSFGRAALPLLRDQTYVPDADLGTAADDIRWMMRSVGLPMTPRDWRSNRSGEYTARSCLASIEASLEWLGGALRECRVAVEGFGKVGSALARLLDERGARVIAVSTSCGALYRAEGLDIQRLLRRVAEVGSRVVEDHPEAERIDRAALLELQADVLAPCARFQSIDSGNAGRIMARIVCAGANDPVTPAAADVLRSRGILHPPDFVTNCGGVLGGTLEFAGVSPDRIARFIDERMQEQVGQLLRRADRSGQTLRAIAEGLALERHERIRRAAEKPGLLGRLVRIGIDSYRRRWIPERMVSWLAPRYVGRRMPT